MTKDELIGIYRETVAVCQDNGYVNSIGEFVYLGSRNAQVGWIRPGQVTRGMNYAAWKDDAVVAEGTRCAVVNEDTVLAGQKLLDEGYNPAILNMASKWRPGGGVERGATAQEESLFRRSNLCLTLDPLKNFHYPFRYDDMAIYCPQTLFFRAPETDGCRFLDSPIRLSVITVPALKLEHGQRDNLPPNWYQVMRTKVEKILDTALEFGHDSVVLGAFGCGAYNNPNRKVAELFRMVLSESDYANRLKKIVFAVMDRHPDDPNGNFSVFNEVFSK